VNYLAALSVGLSMSASILASFGQTPSEKASSQTARSAPELVQQALQVELYARGTSREELLRAALQADPDYAPARWQSGYVRFGKQWLSLDQTREKFSSDPRLAEYARLRREQAGSPDGELFLARWCRSKNLPDEARFHWLQLLQFEPAHEEALRSLAVRRYKGASVTYDEMLQQKKEQFRASRSPRNGSQESKAYWQATVGKWERRGSQSPGDLDPMMKDDLGAHTSDEAIGWVTSILGQRSRNPKASETLRTMNLNWIEFLKERSSNTRYLVMIAIGHPMADIRAAAAEALKGRPKESYVPLMLACARFPVEFSFALTGINATYTFDTEGLEADSHYEHVEGVRQGLDPRTRIFEGPSMRGEARPQPGPSGASALAESLRQQQMQEASFQSYLRLMRMIGDWQRLTLATANQVGRRVEQYNAYAEEINKRVTDALSRATGVDLEANPRACQRWWKDYWYDYYEIEKPTETECQRPVYALNSYRYTAAFSCFQGSTPVWTLTGPVPIQQIRPGDRVLSQNPSSGELAYKTVLAVTTAKPAPMIRLTLGAENIVATRGHPFWVVGERWKMAKHLEVGTRLHSPSGAVPVDAVQAVPVEEASSGYTYNLIVDDFHTYFVGERRVLVHHLTMLSILDNASAGVPGLTVP
jgi:hypothetical protein